MSETKNTLIVKLYGNLGQAPELHTLSERVYTRSVYDASADEAVEREFRKPARELRTFSVAVNAKDEEGNPLPTRWHRCIDWQGHSATFGKGDRVALTGFFKVRKYQKDDEWKEVREFVVTDAKLERANTREQLVA